MFKGSEAARKHMLSHNENLPFECLECPKKYKSIISLRLHVQAIHSTGVKKPFQCKECAYKCRTVTILKYHMRTHTGETPFGCQECSKKFKSTSHLYRHIRAVHQNKENAFGSKDSTKRLASNGVLERHNTRGKQAKSFLVCDYCSQKVTTKTDLMKHMKIHTCTVVIMKI